MSLDEKPQSNAPILVGLVAFFLLLLITDSFWQAVGVSAFLAFIAWYADNFPER